MSAFFRRTFKGGGCKGERLMVVLNDGKRVIVKDDNGNVFLNCSRWLFEQCWQRDYFEDVP